MALLILIMSVGCSKPPEDKFKDYLSGLIAVMETKDQTQAVTKVKDYIQTNQAELKQIAEELASTIEQKSEDEIDDYIANVFKSIHPVMPKLYSLESTYKSNHEMSEALNPIAETLQPVEEAIEAKLIEFPSSASESTPPDASSTQNQPETDTPSDDSETTSEQTDGESASDETPQPEAETTETEPAPDENTE